MDTPEKKTNTGMIVLIIAAVGCLPAIAMIGILAAIAIPNFIQFQCKSKQSEAKTNLSSLYSMEKAFYADHDVFTTDLVSLAWSPWGTPYYVYGFAKPDSNPAPSGVTGYDPTRLTTTDTRVQQAAGYQTQNMYDTMGGALVPAFAEACAPDLCEVVNDRTGDRFLVGAYADIDTDAGVSASDYDTWKINEGRTISSNQDDCLN